MNGDKLSLALKRQISAYMKLREASPEMYSVTPITDDDAWVMIGSKKSLLSGQRYNPRVYSMDSDQLIKEIMHGLNQEGLEQQIFG